LVANKVHPCRSRAMNKAASGDTASVMEVYMTANRRYCANPSCEIRNSKHAGNTQTQNANHSIVVRD
jgi:hypothetical protein